MTDASIIVGTYNRKDILEKTLKAMLAQKFSGKFEVLVIDDGSADGTSEMMKGFAGEKRVRYFPNGHIGPIMVRNMGFKNAKNPIVIIMDDDCIPEKNWLKELTEELTDDSCGVSSFGPDGGTSTAFRRVEVIKAGLFDERFNRFPYREDTDLKLTLEKMTGKKFKYVPHKAKFEHLHRQPQTLPQKIKYGLKRVKVHMNDALLYKKHPEEVKKMLDIRMGFIRNPVEDFKVATGMWHPDKRFSLSSPQGVEFVKNKSVFHTIMIIILGIAYVVMVKIARLYGSIVFGKLLI